MRVLVTGVGGQLGFDVVNELIKRGHDAIGCDIKRYDDLKSKPNCSYASFDITNKKEVEDAITKFKPDAIIHCAAWTNVDGAELKENKPLVKKINFSATNILAKICKDLGIKLMYISTDYVFDGKGTKPWEPDDKDYKPLNYYGQTKLEGEIAVSSQLNNYFIVRIAWVFGLNGKNFVKTMYDLGRSHDSVRVVNDQIGTPTYTYDLARLLVDMIATDKYGYYHVTNEGDYISWYDLTCEIYRQEKMKVKVIPVSTEEYGKNIAERPHNSRLNKIKLIENGFQPLPNWKDAIKRYLDELKK